LRRHIYLLFNLKSTEYIEHEIPADLILSCAKFFFQQYFSCLLVTGKHKQCGKKTVTVCIPGPVIHEKKTCGLKQRSKISLDAQRFELGLEKLLAPSTCWYNRPEFDVE